MEQNMIIGAIVIGVAAYLGQYLMWEKTEENPPPTTNFAKLAIGMAVLFGFLYYAFTAQGGESGADLLTDFYN